MMTEFFGGTGFPSKSHEKRSGIERRCFSYKAHIPERRCGKDRRKTSPSRNASEEVRDTAPGDSIK